MSQDYNYQIVVGYDGKYPLDEYGHFLDPTSIRPVEGRYADMVIKKIKGQNYFVKAKPNTKWESPRKVAQSHICHKEVLGKKRKFDWAKELTNPYGVLHYAIGNGDDFWCFDYAILDDGRVVLNATINSETGSFIMGGGHSVVPIADAASTAMDYVDQAVNWLCDNEVNHTKKGWNQDYYYFYRSVFYWCDKNPNKPNFTDRQIRFGGKKIDTYCGLRK